MFVGLVRLQLFLPAARSLKDRRAVVRRALDRARARHPVSACEAGPAERWQLATLAAVTVSGDASVARDTLDAFTRTVASACAGEAEIVRRETTVDSYPDDEPFGDDELTTLRREPDDDADEA